MTQLINLESYLNCYQYAALFGEDANKLTPASKKNVLPIAYQKFCKRYSEQKFSPFPVLLSQQPNQLTPRHQPLPKSPLGLTLEDDQDEQIFIVRESNTFALRPLQSRYLFTNVYYYWNYASQLQELAQSEKSLVIYNLNCFTPPQIIPLTFESRPHAPYPIPIIDLRKINNLDLNLSLSYEVIYDKICFDLANLIRSKISLEASPQAVADYLKSINFFNNIPQEYNHQPFSLILKLDNTFYTCPLTLQEIQQIIEENLPLDELKQIAHEYRDYNFVFLSPYNNFPRIKQHLNDFLLPQIAHNEFPRIWQHKQENPFPLYGQHLDQISFLVKREGQEEIEEISLPSEICYEGEQEKVLYAQYRDSQQQLKETFPISTSSVKIPFTINGEPFQEQDVEQVYQIEKPYFEETPKLDIKIRFRLKPGSMPKLEVLEQKNGILNSRLVDKVEEQLGFIPFKTIQEFRTQKSQEVLEKLQDPQNSLKQDLLQGLTKLSQSIEKVLQQESHNLGDFLEKLRPIKPIIQQLNNRIGTSSNTAKLTHYDQHFLLPDIAFFTASYKKIVLNTQALLNEVHRKIDHSKKVANNNREELKKLFRNLFLLLGNSYAFTKSESLNFLYQKQRKMYDGKFTVTNIHIYWLNMARLSCTSEKYQQYFNYFKKLCYPNKNTSNKPKLYTKEYYIWGYARILLWYLDFNTAKEFIDYQDHFTSLIKYVLNNNCNKVYLQDVLFALIYLLTFREINPDFVKVESQEYNLAKQLCDKLKDTPVYSKQANTGDASLNEVFANLLDGTATEQQVDRMIEID